MTGAESGAGSASAKRGSTDEGSTMILIIFGALLALVLVLGVAAATSLYLERKRLFTLADGAALAAAESFDLSAVTIENVDSPTGSAGASRVRPVLTDGGVTLAAQRYLASANVAHVDDVVLARSQTRDGRSATIELTTYWRPPVVSLLLPQGIQIDVESTARSFFF